MQKKASLHLPSSLWSTPCNLKRLLKTPQKIVEEYSTMSISPRTQQQAGTTGCALFAQLALICPSTLMGPCHRDRKNARSGQISNVLLTKGTKFDQGSGSKVCASQILTRDLDFL